VAFIGGLRGAERRCRTIAEAILPSLAAPDAVATLLGKPRILVVGDTGPYNAYGAALGTIRAPALQWVSMRLASTLLVAAALAAGCATRPLPRADGRLPPAEPAKPAVASMLVAEQRWLGEWFGGTPVVIAPDRDGALRVEVPLEFAFDKGQTKVKPPLAAVLDKVSTSLKRQAGARIEVSAPTDGGNAHERGASVRDYLVAKGVAYRRIIRLPSHGETVALRLLPPPSVIERLEDEPPAAGRRVAPPR
jgi:outer membrane protein OmpA-like peptidoglycan-associated protein